MVTAFSCDAVAEKCKVTLATEVAKKDLETYSSANPGNVACKFNTGIATPILECQQTYEVHVASHNRYIGKAYTFTVTYKHECYEFAEVYNGLSNAEKRKYWTWDTGKPEFD